MVKTFRMAAVIVSAALAAGGAARADQVLLNAALAHPVLKAGEQQTTYLKVGLTGFIMRRDADRTPVNVAIVIDTSGSMTGEKIRKAKEAAIMAVERLTSRDIATVVEYNDAVRVIVPATKLTDKEAVCTAIRQLEAGGSTALFAGVSKGAQEVRKFLDRNRVNRVILISDGIANVGPSSPGELGDLGMSLIKEGISVTTIGLGTGYNEDLMSVLAARSDGNHYFAENAVDLARVFKGELGDVLSVVAQEVLVTIRCGDGIRPVRVIGRKADITGQTVVTQLNQLYSEQEKYVLLEIEVPATPEGLTRPVATVSVSYANMQTKTTDALTSSLAVRFSNSEVELAAKLNKQVMEAAVEQIATVTNELAMKMRDEGKVEEARALLQSNEKYLEKNAGTLGSKNLKDYAETQAEDAANLDGDEWKTRRKQMVEEQSVRSSQRRR